MFNHGSGEKTAIRVDGIFLLKQIASCNAAIVDLLLLPNSFKRILLVSELDEPAVDGLFYICAVSQPGQYKVF